MCGFLVQQTAGVEFPLIQSMSYFPFFENQVLEKSDLTVALKGYYSNIYSYNFAGSESMINDFELASLVLSIRYGIFNNTVLELFYRYFYVYGGFMDKAIEDFHNLFGLPSACRENSPRNSVQFEYNEHFSYDSGTGTHSPLVLSVLQRFSSSDTFNIHGRFFLGIPIESKSGFVSDKLFYGAGLLFTYTKNNFLIGLAGYISFFKEPEWLNGEGLNNSIFNLNLKIKFKRLLAGFILKTSPIKEGNLSHNAHQVYVGYKVSDNLEIGFIEDLTKFDTTPDICVYFSVRII
jgi:hypothetical protein